MLPCIFADLLSQRLVPTALPNSISQTLAIALTGPSRRLFLDQLNRAYLGLPCSASLLAFLGSVLKMEVSALV